MSFLRLLYFSALTGAIVGLFAWGAAVLLSAVIETQNADWMGDNLVVLSLSLLLTPFLFVQIDRFSGRKFSWVVIGTSVLIAIASAAITMTMLWLLRRNVATESPILYRVAAWSLAGSILGISIGSRWIRSNRMRVLHTYIGGFAGGLLGGMLFVGLGPHQPELCQAAGLMLTGAGIGFGAGIAPLLIRDGAVQFISSADARAQSKYGRAHKYWELKHEETYVIGSLATSQSDTRFQPGADVFIPDASMAPRHAVVFSKEGRFYITRHPDAGGPTGIAKYVLRVRGKTVTTSQELTESDDVLIGRTALRFTTKRQGE